MSGDRSHGGCVAVRTISDYSLTHSHSHSSLSDDGTCGAPVWRGGKGITCVCFKRKGGHERVCINLTPLQACQSRGSTTSIIFLYNNCCVYLVTRAFPFYVQDQRLKRLRHRTKAYFDISRPDHQEALKALWHATYPEKELQSLVSDQWKEMGWQGKDPSTDFRGAGFISLENLLFFAKTFTKSFQSLLQKQTGKRADWEYPFAVAGVNITFMIIQMLDLDANKRTTFIRAVFLQMLSENEWAFDLLYCVAFMILDKLWLEKGATYMEFNDVLKSTRSQLEKEFLMEDVFRIEDMPSYTLLC